MEETSAIPVAKQSAFLNIGNEYNNLTLTYNHFFYTYLYTHITHNTFLTAPTVKTQPVPGKLRTAASTSQLDTISRPIGLGDFMSK